MKEDYGDISHAEYSFGEGYEDSNLPKWVNVDMVNYGVSSEVKEVLIHDKIAPINTACWFTGLDKVMELDLSNLDTSNVTNMSGMFSGCSNLQTLDLSDFDTGNVTDMHVMFGNCSNLQTLNLSTFDTSKVTRMDYMFYGCSNLQTLNDTNSVTDMHGMFNGCSLLEFGNDLDITDWNVDNVRDFMNMFYLVAGDTFDISKWNIAEDADITTMFDCDASQEVITVYVKDEAIKNRFEQSNSQGDTKFLVK